MKSPPTQVEITRETTVWRGGIRLGVAWKDKNGWAAEEFKNGCSWDFIDTEEDAIKSIKLAWE